MLEVLSLPNSTNSRLLFNIIINFEVEMFAAWFEELCVGCSVGVCRASEN